MRAGTQGSRISLHRPVDRPYAAAHVGRPEGRHRPRRPTFLAEYTALIRVVVLVGVPVGALAIGLGGRLAMLLLRLTSPYPVDRGDRRRRLRHRRGHAGRHVQPAHARRRRRPASARPPAHVSPWLIGPTWFRRHDRRPHRARPGAARCSSTPTASTSPSCTRGGWPSACSSPCPRWSCALLLGAGGPQPPTPVPRAVRGSRRWPLPLALLALVPLGVLAAAIPVLLGVAILLLLAHGSSARIHSQPAGDRGRAVRLLRHPRPLGRSPSASDLVELF